MTTSPPPPPPAPGWYPDPGGGGQRFWNGSTWTEHSLGPPPPVPPTTGQQQKKKIKYFFLGLLVLIVGYNLTMGQIDRREEAKEKREVDAWGERILTLSKDNPRLWLDYQKASALSDFQPICAEMRKRWVVDLNALIPAPESKKKFDDLFRGVIDAADSATGTCLALTPSSSDGEFLALDEAMTSLQEKWIKVGEAIRDDLESS